MATTKTSKDVPPLELQIEKLVYGGDGLARHNGQVILTPFVLPGECVSVAPQPARSGVARGIPLQILQAAPERVIPRCEYFTRCGGCQYQHADYSAQLKQKQNILRETLRRLGGIEFGNEIAIISGEPWNYRNRIQLHFEDRRSGFRRAGSHRLCAIDHCHISSPLLVEAIGKLQAAVKEPQWPTFLRSVELFTNESDLQLTVIESTRPVAVRFFEWCRSFLPSMVPGTIEYMAAEMRFQISRGSFFQVNRFLIDALVREALDDAHGEQAIDLYAGVGLFSLSLASRFNKVTAVERGGPAYRDLQANATRTGTNIIAAKAPAEEFLRNLTESPDLIVADPPRAGLGREATVELLRLKPEKLTIVSCDPATLSRDLAALAPSYRIRRLTLIDLFPQTYHFESVAHLSRS